MRGAEQLTEALRDALASQHMESQETIEITDTAELDVGGVATRSTSLGEPSMVLEVPDAGQGFGQVVLAIDEAGVTTWNLPEDEGETGDATRGGTTRTYVIRRHVPPVGDPGATRGLTGALGKKLLKVLVFPIIDPLSARRPTIGEQVTKQTALPACAASRLDDYRGARRPRWAARVGRLAGGRACCSCTAPSAVPTAPLAMPPYLRRRAAPPIRRAVFAFDHFTMSDDHGATQSC